jgi:hypothetical protein
MVEKREELESFEKSTNAEAKRQAHSALTWTTKRLVRKKRDSTYATPSGWRLSVPSISKYPLVRVSSRRFFERRGDELIAP